jgi:hypothetical protein
LGPAVQLSNSNSSVGGLYEVRKKMYRYPTTACSERQAKIVSWYLRSGRGCLHFGFVHSRASAELCTMAHKIESNPSWHSSKFIHRHPQPPAPPEANDEGSCGWWYWIWPLPMGIAFNWQALHKSPIWNRFIDKRNDVVALLGLLLGFGSWGYSVLSPEPQIWFGMLLLSGAFICFAALLIHLFGFRWKGRTAVIVVVGLMFWVYTRKIVISPLYKRDLVAELEEGYGLRDECGSRQYYDDAPRFMGESEERWMARVQTTLAHAGKVDDLQIWEGSDLVGLVAHSNLIGFRCTRMAIKTSALETIISRHYDPKIVANPYNGPVYVLDLQKGASIKLPNNGGTIELKATQP